MDKEHWMTSDGNTAHGPLVQVS